MIVYLTKSIIVKLLILVLQTLPVELNVYPMSRLAHHRLIASSNDSGVELKVPPKRCHEKLHEEQFWAMTLHAELAELPAIKQLTVTP